MTQGIYQFPKLNTPELINGIASHHWEEWEESAVSDEIIKLNVRSIYDAREIDKILGRNTTRKWKHSDNLIPAWYASGVDPLTDEPTLQGVQVKPDNTPINKDGKPQKYIGASGMETAPLFLRTTIEAYWKSIIDDFLKFVIITEGAKKAAAGLSAGYPTISIPGVTTCRKKGRLHPLLELFAVLGRTFYLCFDNDVLYKKPVQDGLLGLAKELAARGSKVMIINLPSGDAKGMDDYISLHGQEAFDKLIHSACTFEEWKEEINNFQLEYDDEPKSKIARNFQIINEAWGESLRYNSLKKEIELNGYPINIEYIKLILGLEFSLDVSKEDALTIVEYIAKKNTYSPVVEYLDEVEAKYPEVETSFLDGLAKLFFGTDDPIHAKYFKNFLVASVARARNPGCWMDCALLLVGAQGIRKSTFWRTLYGDDFFSDDLGDGGDKDERMKMHRFWCLEWSEFETVYKRKDIAQLKAFLARRHETFRTPYDRLPKDYKRNCVFAGTTNEKQILNDPTGNRRFWIIPVAHKIPVEEAQKLRDRIWAAANALYKTGYSYRLTDAEEIVREAQNEEYEVIDPWEEIISPFICNRQYVTLQEIYQQLSIEPSKQEIRNQNRITALLRRLDWEPDRIKVGGRWVRIWREKKNNSNCAGSAGSAGSNDFSIAEKVTEQVSQTDPLENSPVDQVCHDTLPKTDPLEEKIKITVSQAHSKDLSEFDPADPAVFETEESEITVNGFRLGEKVIITTHESQPDWVGSEEDIKQFGQVWVKFVSGRYAKLEHIRPASSTQPTSPLEERRVEATDEFACPPLDDYYSNFSVKPYQFGVDTVFGTVKVTATPFKKIKSTGHSEVHFLFETPGKKAVENKKILISKKEGILRLAKESPLIKKWEAAESRKWLKRIGNDCLYKVKKLSLADDQDYEWIENCTLYSVPQPPTSNHFTFKTLEGTIIPTVGIDDFEVM